MTLGNALTCFRIIAAPVVLAMFLWLDGIVLVWWILAISIMAELSDIFDGYFARRANTVSDFGKLADPFADSFLRLTVFFCYAHEQWLPFWIPMILMYRDLIVSALRMHALKQSIVVAARPSGKIKAVVQGTCQFIILLLLIRSGGIATQDITQVALYAGIFTAAVTIYSCVDYFQGILKTTSASA